MTWLNAAHARRMPSTDEERNAFVTELLSTHKGIYGDLRMEEVTIDDTIKEGEGEGSGDGGEGDDKTAKETEGANNASTDDKSKAAAADADKPTAEEIQAAKDLSEKGEKALQSFKERARKAEAELKKLKAPEDPIVKFQRGTARAAIRSAAAEAGFGYGKLINKLIDTDGIEFDDDGDIDETEVAERIAQAKKDYPELFKVPSSDTEDKGGKRTPSGGGASGDDGKSKGLATQAELEKRLNEDPDFYEKAIKDPRFKHLFGK